MRPTKLAGKNRVATLRMAVKAAASALLALAVIGCGSGQKPTFKVRGKVVDSAKKPAVGAMVTLHPVKADPNDPARPTATVNEKGEFALTTFVSEDGAPEGDYIVTVIWPTPRKTPIDPPGIDQLNGSLARPENSTIKYTVEKKPEQEVPTITLTVP